ncbi:MAG TPA: hypothetical protein PLE99_04560 [Candidatus Thiothrix moscowensis]|jgi:hypothetical protein|uniref:hypothetical protein n=1 Tax=unclassified Thiothrix TaxID=2636184 RepID=UPI001A31A2FA|nr:MULTISPECIES: hypothetical protein [unclassified Thiothrix]MBJ6609410.1 hypothetical protein [Candidatus Thiothrix moscowensis]HRJ52020.1 hypothetical protein [Candidatus Thiothrix moscowensis]HRJ92469.1 hypothetical protein [Candidatus Thiothrix moscowensis]
MKPRTALFHTSLLLVMFGSQPVFAVDSESLADELKKLRKTVTAEQPTQPVPPKPGSTAVPDSKLATGK